MKPSLQISLCFCLLLTGMVMTLADDDMPATQDASASQKVYGLDRKSLPVAYIPVPDALGAIDLAVSDESLPMAERLVEALQQRQPGLIVNLRTVSLTVSEQWWRTVPVSKAGLFFLPMSTQEKSAFVQARGYQPVELRIAADAIAIVVSPDNPIANRGLTLAEIDGIFSKTRRRGHRPLRSWEQLGLEHHWQERPIEPVAQLSTASASQHFRRLALNDGDYRSGISRLNGSDQVILRVSSQVSAIGYIARSQLDNRVKSVTVSGSVQEHHANSAAVDVPFMDNPLRFWLYLYVDRKPNAPLAATTRALLRFCYSREGQQLLSKAGYIGVNSRIATEDLDGSGLDRSSDRDSD